MNEWKDRKDERKDKMNDWSDKNKVDYRKVSCQDEYGMNEGKGRKDERKDRMNDWSDKNKVDYRITGKYHARMNMG